MGGFLLYCSGYVQVSDARRRELTRVDVGHLPQSSVHVVQVLALHHQNGLGRVEMELRWRRRWVERRTWREK